MLATFSRKGRREEEHPAYSIAANNSSGCSTIIM